jgi:hypothetical protein
MAWGSQIFFFHWACAVRCWVADMVSSSLTALHAIRFMPWDLRSTAVTALQLRRIFLQRGSSAWLLLNPRLCYRAHRSLPLGPILGPPKPDRSFTACISKTHFNIILPFTPMSFKWGLFLSHPTRNMYVCMYVCISLPSLPLLYWRPCNAPWFPYWRVQITTLLMHFSLFSSYSLFDRAKLSNNLQSSLFLCLGLFNDVLEVHRLPTVKCR